MEQIVKAWFNEYDSRMRQLKDAYEQLYEGLSCEIGDTYSEKLLCLNRWYDEQADSIRSDMVAKARDMDVLIKQEVQHGS